MIGAYHFSPLQTLLLDISSWLLVHLVVSYICSLMPVRWFEGDQLLYREFPFEDGGRLYTKIFKIKKWKPLLPDGAALFRRGFKKKQLADKTHDYFQLFIAETRRAELTHWLSMLPAPIFFLWNDGTGSLVMVIYAVLANLPCLLAQRYNRIRFSRIKRRPEGKMP